MKKYYILDENNYLSSVINCSGSFPFKKKFTDVPLPNKKHYLGFVYRFDEENQKWIYEVQDTVKYNEFIEDIDLSSNKIISKTFKPKQRARCFLFMSLKSALANYVVSEDSKISSKEKKETSVLIPCYNKSDFVMETLDSVLKQTVLPKEILILLMDEKSIELKDEIESKSSLIKTEVCERKDIIEARMYLANKCQTTDFIFLDADDLLAENFIEECYKSDAYFVFPKARFLSDGNFTEEIFSKSYSFNIIVGNMTGLMNKEKFFELNGLDYSFDKVLEDYDLKFRIAEANFKIDFNEKTYYYLRRDTSEKFKKTSVVNEVINNGEHEKYFFKLLINHIDYISSQINDKNNFMLKICNLIKKFKTELENDEYETLYNYMALFIEDKQVDVFNEELDLEFASVDVGYFINELHDIICNLPFYLFKEIELDNKTTNHITEDITALVFGNNNKKNVNACIDGLKQNNIKNIIVLIDDKDVIEHKDVTIIKNATTDVKKASKIMSKKAKTDWYLLIDGDAYLHTELFNEEFVIGLNSDVLFLKGDDNDFVTFKDYMNGENYCIIHKDLFEKTEGFSNNYDFSLDCYKMGNCDFTERKRFTNYKEGTDNYFYLTDEPLKILKKHRYIIDDIIGLYKKYPNTNRKNSLKLLENVFEIYEPVYEFINNILNSSKLK